jgi:hypothetical protein
MQTGPESQSVIRRRSSETCRVRKTRLCKQCGRPFIPSRRDKWFHSEDCRYDWHNFETGNLRSAERHLRRHLDAFSRRGFLNLMASAGLGFAEEFLDGTRTDRHEKIHRELAHLNNLMVRVGPVKRQIRERMRSGAQAVLTALGPAPMSAWERLAAVSAWEILRDAGVEAPLTWDKVHMWLQASAQSVRFFLERGVIADSARCRHLARTMICRRNIFHFLETQPPIYIPVEESRRRSKSLLTGAENMLFGLDESEPEVAQLAHQIQFRKARPGRYLESVAVENTMKRLERLAKNANDPRVWVEHFRELAGFTSYHLRDRSRANEYLAQMDGWRERLADFTRYADGTLFTPRIASLLETKRSGAKEEAIHLVEHEFIPYYEGNPHLYYSARICTWLGHDIAAPEQYATAFIGFFNRLDPENP